MIGVYKITNPKGAIYIGSSKEIEVRFKRYKKLLCKSQPKLYNSLLKYGVDNHSFEVVCECDFSELYEQERSYGLHFNVLSKSKGLNCVIPKNGELKSSVSEESLINRSNAQKGKKASLETKIKMANSQKGRKHSEETIVKMRLNNLNTKLILDLSTGIFYNGTSEVSEFNCINRHTLKNMLNGSKRNRTQFVYC